MNGGVEHARLGGTLASNSGSLSPSLGNRPSEAESPRTREENAMGGRLDPDLELPLPERQRGQGNE